MAKLFFYYSSMNAGKSTTLLQSSFNYQERGMQTLLLTAAFDDRFEPTTDLCGLIQEKLDENHIDCILVDEAQFLTKDQVWQLSDVADKLGVPVLCYGIRTDFQGALFEGSKWLLAWADKLSELKTICHCGRKAGMVLRVDENGNTVREGAQVEIGGNDRYVSVCRRHFKDAMGQ